MNLRLSLLVVTSSLVGLVFLLACSGDGSERGQSPAGAETGEAEEPMVNRIAYIDNSGDLFLVNPDGTGVERITGDVRAGLLAQALERGDSYSWPTWSQDGTRLAVSRVALSGSSPDLSVQVLDLATGGLTSAYTNEVPAPVADGTPHYIYWSPDGRYLSFLAPTPEGLRLFVKDYQSDDEPASVAVGAPLYYHWTPDSRLLAVHNGDRVTLQEPTVDGRETRVAVDAFNFRAPAISPDGSRLAFVGIVGGVEGVYVVPALLDTSEADTSDAPRLLLETQGMTAFAWAPDGSSLAVAEQSRGGVPLFDRLSLISPDGSARSSVVEEQVLSFFWSPVGDSIAWVGLNPQSREMSLNVSPVAAGQATGESRQLFRFSPTGEMFIMFSFFDQYAYSHSIWSPDGSALVVAGNEEQEGGRRNGSSPSGGQIYVVDVRTGESRRIASGKVALWSSN